MPALSGFLISASYQPGLPVHVTALLTFNVNLLLQGFPLLKTFLNIRPFSNLFGPPQNHQVEDHT